MYNEMTLEQRWEHIFECNNDYCTHNAVRIDVVVQKERGVSWWEGGCVG